MFKNFILATALSVAIIGNVAAADSLLDRINHKGTITVGTEGTYSPFSYHDAEGNLTGYDVEVTRAVADQLGVKVDFRETNWDSMLAGLKAGRFDLVANQVTLNTPERRATFDASENYSWDGPVMVTHKDETRIHDLNDIKGLRAAQTLTSNHGENARKNGAEIVPVDGLAQGLMLLQQKRADLSINSGLSVLDYLKKNPNAPLKIVWSSDDKLGSGFIADKGNEAALEKINAAIDRLRQDGTLKKLGERFFGADISVK